MNVEPLGHGDDQSSQKCLPLIKLIKKIGRHLTKLNKTKHRKIIHRFEIVKKY